jgi:hypothetical protein
LGRRSSIYTPLCMLTSSERTRPFPNYNNSSYSCYEVEYKFHGEQQHSPLEDSYHVTVQEQGVSDLLYPSKPPSAHPQLQPIIMSLTHTAKSKVCFMVGFPDSFGPEGSNQATVFSCCLTYQYPRSMNRHDILLSLFQPQPALFFRAYCMQLHLGAFLF